MKRAREDHPPRRSTWARPNNNNSSNSRNSNDSTSFAQRTTASANSGSEANIGTRTSERRDFTTHAAFMRDPSGGARLRAVARLDAEERAAAAAAPTPPMPLRRDDVSRVGSSLGHTASSGSASRRPSSVFSKKKGDTTASSAPATDASLPSSKSSGHKAGSTTCSKAACRKRATFGFPEGWQHDPSESAEAGGAEPGRPIRCEGHALTGSSDRRCIQEGCGVWATFSSDGGKPTYCAKHKKKDMVDVKNKRCMESGCKIRPSFGFEAGYPQRCSKHKLPGMVDVKNRRCEGADCNRRPSYGFPGSKATRCARHSLAGMTGAWGRSGTGKSSSGAGSGGPAT